jgi:hypothetical protein
LFISIRIAASAAQVLQVRWLPRGARMAGILDFGVLIVDGG